MSPPPTRSTAAGIEESETMKVSDLIRILQTQDPDAEVFMMNQPRYPIEHRVAGVAVRGDFSDDGPPEDVILVEGEWRGYGDRDAWDAARR